MSEIPEVFAIFEQKLAHVLSFTIIAQRNNTKQAIEELLVYFSGIVERANKAEARIAELEAERRWIPVSERLPEDGEVVWLWDGNNLGMGYYLVLAGQFMDRDTPLRRIKPTHWMPLPSTPEVQE